MPSRQNAQEDFCKPESIPRWSLPVSTLFPGMLFQSQDTPLKYTRTIDKPSKNKTNSRNPCPAEKTPRRISASQNQSPGDRFQFVHSSTGCCSNLKTHHWNTPEPLKNLAKLKKSYEIHAQLRRRPGGSLPARINPQVIASSLYISHRMFFKS